VDQEDTQIASPFLDLRLRSRCINSKCRWFRGGAFVDIEGKGFLPRCPQSGGDDFYTSYSVVRDSCCPAPLRCGQR
jgi:hypothetical protein